MKKTTTPDHSLLANPKENVSKVAENDDLPKPLKTTFFYA
jgi:hypothetical protein